MKIAIVGAGVIGLTSGWAVARDGHEVVVVDRAEGPGLETSFANGSLLTPSMADPWNAPGCWKVLLGSLGRSDAALQLRVKALPSMVSWGLRFLWNSRADPYHRNTRANLLLSLASLEAMERLREDAPFDYERRAKGTLRIFRNADALDRAVAAARLIERDGVTHQVLAGAEPAALEPGLAPIAGALAGAIHYPIDETGDAQAFCARLAAVLEARGVDLRYGATVERIEVRDGTVCGVIADGEAIGCDGVVVAAGSHSAPLLRGVGLSLPVRPAKGYSVTIPADVTPLSLPVIDDTLHAVIAPMAGRLRVAGTAEFAGFDRSIDPARVRNLTGLVRAVLPDLDFDEAEPTAWTGLRALTVDGVPLIGRTRIDGLWVNTGHGHLGWTMAAGSGELIASLIGGGARRIDPVPYAPNRFGV